MRRSVLIPLVLLVLVVAGGLLALGLGGGGGSKAKLPGNAKSTGPGGGFLGAELNPVKQAPPLRLRDYQGKPVNISSYRGKAVLVTFLYVHCPDVCPAIASALRVAEDKLGAQASKVQVIAVSVDPRHDTPSSIARFLQLHRMTGRMQYLVGSAAQLAPVWSAWNVGSQKDKIDPQFVAHSALVYGISASGKVRTIYPANFKPSDVAHDVPLLAAS